MYGTDKKERSRREKRFIRQEEQLRQVLSEKKCRRQTEYKKYGTNGYGDQR